MIKFLKHTFAILLGGMLGIFIFFTFIDTISKYIIKDGLTLSTKQYKSISTVYAKNGDVINYEITLETFFSCIDLAFCCNRFIRSKREIKIIKI